MIGIIYEVVESKNTASLWNQLPPNTIHYAVKGMYFTTMSENDNTPVFVAVQGDSDFNDYIFWYTWNTNTMQFEQVKNYSFIHECDCVMSGDTTSFLLNSDQSPNKHPQIILTCSLNPPVILDLWTLKEQRFNITSYHYAIELFQIWYSSSTPNLIWATDIVYRFYAWDLTTLQMVDYLQFIDNFYCTLFPYNGLFLYNYKNTLLQWKMTQFLNTNTTPPVQYNLTIPFNTLYSMVSTTNPPTVYALSHNQTGSNACRGIASYLITDSQPPQLQSNTVVCLNLQINGIFRDIRILSNDLIIIPTINPNTITTISTPKISVIDSFTLPTNLPNLEEYHDLVAIPTFAQNAFPFNFIVQFDVFPSQGGFLMGCTFLPYSMNK